MILTGPQIVQEIKAGNIIIDPFRESSIQPNSYDYHLGEDFITYKSKIIRGKGIKDNQVTKFKIPPEGYILKRGELYLGITEEFTASQKYAQLLFGDKSLGSMGVWTQITAPLGHVGHRIRWTLEIRCVKDVIVYPGMKFGKICFLGNEGVIKEYGSEHYVNSGRYLRNEIIHSLIHKD